mgnify:CR=1 FL=1
MTDEEMLALNRAGRMASEIARLTGLTRAAVCGRLYRERQRTGDSEVIDQTERGKRMVKERHPAKGRKAAGQEKQQLVQGGGDALALVGPRDCRYPIGTPGSPGFAFCRQPRHENRPYCLHHLRLCIIVDKQTAGAMPT